MPYFHFTASNRWPLQPFKQRKNCVEMWARLQARFERVLACILMPDHLHLIVESTSAISLGLAMKYIMAGATRRISPKRPLWQPAPAPSLIPNIHHLKRQIRYVHLNPCRSGFASDPLEWEWSTHRDAIGAAAPSWLDLPLLAKAWNCDSSRFPSTFHAYVSSDPTVRVDGTPLPRHASINQLATPLDSIVWAIEQATHSPSDCRLRNTEARRLMFHLADRIGSVPRDKLANWTDITARRVRAILADKTTPAEEEALRAATLLLSARPRFELSKLPQSGSIQAM